MRSWPSPGVPDLGALGVARPGTPIRVPDTSTGELRELTDHGGEVRIYACGITPYDATHLGHAATYLLFDLLSRAALDAGKRVRFVENITDVDDPLLERAQQTGDDWIALAERETELFRADMAALRILPPAAYVGAVEAIPDIAEAVRELVAAGAAYELDGDVYFSVAATSHFGEVSGLAVPEMLTLFAERGGDPKRPGKKDPLDPLLWRAERPEEPAWDSPLGRGRPGWHIECAAIALRELGSTLDIQGGGADLVFPHHEMSAAHGTVLTGAWPYARNHVHQAFVGYQGQKMSKSKGNLVLVSKLRGAGADPMAIRLALLAHSSRNDWEWHDGQLADATNRLRQWRAGVARSTTPPVEQLVREMRAALANGLDAPAACDAVDRWCRTEGDDAGGADDAAVAIDALLGVDALSAT